MEVLIEATQAYRMHLGWGRYNWELIKNLPALSPNDNFTLFYNTTDKNERSAIQDLTADNVNIVALNFTEKEYCIYEEDRTHSFVDQQFPGIDIYHAVTEYPFATQAAHLVTTIHELTPLLFPELYPPSFRLEFEESIRYALSHSKAIITVSNSTKQDILRLFNHSQNNIYAIPNGVSEVFIKGYRNLSAPIHRQEKPYILYVGSVNKKVKNFQMLADVFSEMQYPVDMVIVNKEHSRNSLMQKFSIPERHSECVHVLGSVNDDKLLDLYQSAELLVYPSSYEGFGLPIAEAMASGCAVLCGANPATLETSKEYCKYFDPSDAGSLREEIRRCLEYYPTSLISDAAEYVKKYYDWKAASIKYLEVYNSIL
ncbi:glycosyltransferase family 4 protein [Planctomycetota bacterium]